MADGVRKLTQVIRASGPDATPRQVVRQLLDTATGDEIADLLMPAAVVFCKMRKREKQRKQKEER